MITKLEHYYSKESIDSKRGQPNRQVPLLAEQGVDGLPEVIKVFIVFFMSIKTLTSRDINSLFCVYHHLHMLRNHKFDQLMMTMIKFIVLRLNITFLLFRERYGRDNVIMSDIAKASWDVLQSGKSFSSLWR